MLINFKNFKQGHKDFEVCPLANRLRACTSQLIPDEDIIQLIRLCLKHDERVIMEQLRKRELGEDMPGFVARLEDVLQEKASRTKVEEAKAKKQRLAVE